MKLRVRLRSRAVDLWNSAEASYVVEHAMRSSAAVNLESVQLGGTCVFMLPVLATAHGRLSHSRWSGPQPLAPCRRLQLTRALGRTLLAPEIGEGFKGTGLRSRVRRIGSVLAEHIYEVFDPWILPFMAASDGQV